MSEPIIINVKGQGKLEVPSNFKELSEEQKQAEIRKAIKARGLKNSTNPSNALFR